MANYSVALGVRPPQLDATRAFEMAANMRRMSLAEQQAAMANRMGEARLAQIGRENQRYDARQNALAEYNKTKNMDALAQHPDLLNQMLDIRGKMAANEQAAFDRKVKASARDAMRLKTAYPEGSMERASAYRMLLQKGLEAGRYTQQEFDHYSKMPPTDAFLDSVVQQGVNLDTIYKRQNPEPTSAMQNVEAAMAYPEGDLRRDALLKQGRDQIIIAGPKKGSEAMFKATTDAFVKAQQEGAAAQDNLVQNEVLRQSLSNPDLFTGTGGNVVQTFKGAAQALGFDVEGVADGEIVQTVGNRAALALKDDLPGPLSDGDRQFLVNIPPGLTKSPEANRRLLLLSDLNNQFKVERARIYRESLNEDGSVPPSVFAAEARLKAQFNRKMKSHVAELRAQAKQVSPRSPLAGVPIGEMNRTQLNKLDPSKLTRQQLLEAVERERELDAQ